MKAFVKSQFSHIFIVKISPSRETKESTDIMNHASPVPQKVTFADGKCICTCSKLYNCLYFTLFCSQGIP